MKKETSEWRTRVDPEWSAAYGVAELHIVMFESDDDHGGPCACLILPVPEASSAQIQKAIDGAIILKGRLGFVCDTRAQADEIAVSVGKRLPAHHRISYERAEAAGWGRPHV